MFIWIWPETLPGENAPGSVDPCGEMDVMAGIEDLVKELSPEHQREALDFVAYLLQKQKRKQAKPLRQTWAGALRRYRGTYTALELQKESLSWRTE
jgi:hypothetical protein